MTPARWAALQARIAPLIERGPAARGSGRWDREQAFPGGFESTGRRGDDAD